jgi:radical SAM protein with 4Fe4S-binding SPASM domain
MNGPVTAVGSGPSDYRDPHLEHRKAQELEHFAKAGSASDPMTSLASIEFNITELCNRKCVFCPRIDPDIYPNRNLNMSLTLADRVASEIAREGLKCRISFSGFGEPLLHNKFVEMVQLVRARLATNVIEMNTSGDRLNPAKVRELYDAGVTYIYVNLYDGPEQKPSFEAMFAEAGAQDGRWRLRPHWPGSNRDYGLTLNNRSGVVNAPDIQLGPVAEPLQMPCYYPFYKMLLDWNGDVLFCANDWGREIVVGNVERQSLRDVWMSERMWQVRRALAKSDRSASPCRRCNVHGVLHGGGSFKLLIAHYERHGLLAPGEVPV